jgi:hypothetical protein
MQPNWPSRDQADDRKGRARGKVKPASAPSQASRKVALEQEKKTECDARYAAWKVRKLERQKSPFGKFGRR